MEAASAAGASKGSGRSDGDGVKRERFRAWTKGLLRSRSGLPAITHQTTGWELTAEQSEWRRRMIAMNPDWEHRFYNDADCRDLVRSSFPNFLRIYDAYPLPVQRADVFRVVAVYRFGGIYLDIDMNVLAPLAPLLKFGCVVAEEMTLDVETAARLGHAERLRVANYMFGSRAGHPFWLDLLEEMERRAAMPLHTAEDVLQSTGPGLLSTMFARRAHKYADITLLPHPTSVSSGYIQSSPYFGAFAEHLTQGSWRGQISPN